MDDKERGDRVFARSNLALRAGPPDESLLLALAFLLLAYTPATRASDVDAVGRELEAGASLAASWSYERRLAVAGWIESVHDELELDDMDTFRPLVRQLREAPETVSPRAAASPDARSPCP